MKHFALFLLVLYSLNHSSHGALLANLKENLIGGNRIADPTLNSSCPDANDIVPCFCFNEVIDGTGGLILDCTDISNEDLTNVFSQSFPSKEFYEFRMNSSDTLTSLDVDCNGVTFKRFFLSPGNFSLDLVSDNFYASCSYSEMEYVRLTATQLSYIAFPPLPFRETVKQFFMFDSKNVDTIPVITSSSLQTFELTYALYSEIVPGTFDNLPNLKNLFLDLNQLSELKNGTIPIYYNGFGYTFHDNIITKVEPGAFFFITQPPVNSLKIFLSKNFLRTIDEEVFAPLMPYIDTLGFFNNPLDCGCDIAWLITNPEFSEKVTKVGDPRCADGVLLSDLDPDVFGENC